MPEIARRGCRRKLRCTDFYDTGDQYCFRFREKGGKQREIPARFDLQQFVREYLSAGGLIYCDSSTPLFRTTVRCTKQLTQNGMTAGDMGRMVKRRIRDVGLPERLSPHSFRVTTITDLLSQGVPLDDGQSYCLLSQWYTGFMMGISAGFSVIQDVSRRFGESVSRSDVRQRCSWVSMACKVL